MKALKKYLKANGLTAKEFSRKAEVDHSQISRYMRGLVKPSLENAYRIEKTTKGKVKMESWIC